MAGILSPIYGLSKGGGTLTGSLAFTGATGTVLIATTGTLGTLVGTTATIGTITGTTGTLTGALVVQDLDVSSGDVDIQTAGQGLAIANGGAQQGTNCKIGTGSLNAGGGVGTVPNTSITANSYIFITDTEAGGVTNLGALAVISQSAGTNFVVKSSSATDTSTFNYLIIEPG